ncbi:MAG: HDIG domain-containing metalloprotein [bacterium]|jgi:putative nucleotidyltransferase with HDIG domain
MFSNFSINEDYSKKSNKFFNKFFNFVLIFFKNNLKKFVSFFRNFNKVFKDQLYFSIFLSFIITLFLFFINYYLLFRVYDITKIARFDIIADKDLIVSGYTYETMQKLKQIFEIKEYYIDIKNTEKTMYNIDNFFLVQINRDYNKLRNYFNEFEINLVLSVKPEYIEYFYNLIKVYLHTKLEKGIEPSDISKLVNEIDGILDIFLLSNDQKEIQKLIDYKNIILKKIPSLIVSNKIIDIQKTLQLQREYLKNIPKYFEIKKGEIIVNKGTLINSEFLDIIKKMGLDKKYYKIQLYYLINYSIIVFLIFILLLILFDKLVIKNEDYDYLFRFNFISLLLTIFFINFVVFIKFYLDFVYFVFPFLLFCFIIYHIISIRLAWVYFGVILALLELLNYLYYNSFIDISFIVPFIISGILFFVVFGNIYDEENLSYTLANEYFLFFILSVFVFSLFNIGNSTNILFWVISVSLFYMLGNFLISYFGKGLGGIPYQKVRELLDLNNELLTMLKGEAPGTFNHSIRVSELCENCAKAINANPLLVKLGALYHDIGKIDKPSYFAENLEEGQENPHDKIEPHLSAIIIKNHVKKGIEIANKYKLPRKLIDFIRTHHGTTTIWYFYTKALQKAKENKKYEVDINDYKYDGPKPYTKEMVILMICDSIEAASRSLNEISFNSIYKLTENIINRLFNEDQFSDSNITLNEINIIKQEVINYLLISYHKRVAYPAFKKTI